MPASNAIVTAVDINGERPTGLSYAEMCWKHSPSASCRQKTASRGTSWRSHYQMGQGDHLGGWAELAIWKECPHDGPVELPVRADRRLPPHQLNTPYSGARYPRFAVRIGLCRVRWRIWSNIMWRAHGTRAENTRIGGKYEDGRRKCVYTTWGLIPAWIWFRW